jgi:hypothetical protein
MRQNARIFSSESYAARMRPIAKWPHSQTLLWLCCKMPAYACRIPAYSIRKLCNNEQGYGSLQHMQALSGTLHWSCWVHNQGGAIVSKAMLIPLVCAARCSPMASGAVHGGLGLRWRSSGAPSAKQMTFTQLACSWHFCALCHSARPGPSMQQPFCGFSKAPSALTLQPFGTSHPLPRYSLPAFFPEVLKIPSNIPKGCWLG